MNSITITLPVPPVAVRPNGRSHWRAKAKAVKTMRCGAALTCCTVDRFAAWRCLEPRFSRASIRIDWYHPTARFLDRDNIIASCKAYIDGIVDAGVLADDRDVTYEPVGRFKATKGTEPRVEITVTPTEPDRPMTATTEDEPTLI